jgi:hypothetical protein
VILSTLDEKKGIALSIDALKIPNESKTLKLLPPLFFDRNAIDPHEHICSMIDRISVNILVELQRLLESFPNSLQDCRFAPEQSMIR